MRRRPLPPLLSILQRGGLNRFKYL